MSKKCKGVIIALGYFDCVHTGHKKVIERAVNISKKTNAQAVVFTFNKPLLTKAYSSKSVLTYKERKEVIERLNAKVFSLSPTENLLKSTGEEFLDLLNEKFDICGYVSGKDYKYGSDMRTVVDLIAYAKSHNQKVITVGDEIKSFGKVSTGVIVDLLSKGKIEKANKLLTENYFVTGRVISGRNVGNKLGFPTANLKVHKEKYLVKDGVYLGKAYIEDKEYKAVINVGESPTFNRRKKLIEAHLINFDGDLYKTAVKIEFNKRLRDVKKFSSEEKLKAQIEKDVIKAKEYL